MNQRLQLEFCVWIVAVAITLPASAAAWNIPTLMVQEAMTYQMLRQESPSAIEGVNLILEQRPWHEKRWRGQLDKLADAECGEMTFMLAPRWADDIRLHERQQHRRQWHCVNFPFRGWLGVKSFC